MLMRWLAVVLGTVAVLAALNVVPAWLGGEPRGVLRYPSLGALQARYHVRLSAPAGPPTGPVRFSVAWPGWLAYAAGPRGDAGGDRLVVCQTLTAVPADAAPDLQVPEALLPGGEQLQASEVSAAGQRAELRRVLLADGALVYELWWREGGRRVMLRTDGDADRLVRLFTEVVRHVP
jgi:hypothetical protein